MRISLRWLQEMIELPTTDVSELGYVLDMLGHKVESAEKLEIPWTGVHIGRVIEVAAHPDADRIRVCQVETGSGISQIICGAWNFESGATVAVARPGALLAGGMEIGSRAIRGVNSNGMICSEKELGLGDDHEGILVLDESASLGVPLEDLIELPDVVFDLEITSNRPDAMSVLGIARDLAAHYDVDYRIPEHGLSESGATSTYEVEIQDTAGCRRFTLREITGVTVTKSPLWMRHRLTKVGVRPVSNVVDVTNYVMLELGHPLHAFDADKVEGRRLIVRRAAPGERLETLDHVIRDLSPDDLIIYDDAGPTSMAGTMGGAGSEVTPLTTNVLMEAASWDPPTIMYMSRRHDLRSEASARFERGVDPGLADLANQRASAMVGALAGGSVLGGAVDVITEDFSPKKVTLTHRDVERLLGKGFEDETPDILERLGMAVEGGDPMTVTVPTYRPDLTRPADLVEEIARLHGFDRFEATLPTGRSGGLTSEQRRLRELMTVLRGAGLNQAIDLPFVGVQEAGAFGFVPDDLLTVRNPLREEESKLRPSLLPGLLGALRHNLAHGSASVGLFEVGSVFSTEPSELDSRLPDQPERLAWVTVGDVGLSGLSGATTIADGRVALGLWRLVAGAMDVPAEVRKGASAGFHPGRTAEIVVDGDVVGHVGELSPTTARLYGIVDRVAVAEIDLAPLVRSWPHPGVTGPSVYPHVDFDLSFTLDGGTPAGDLVVVTTEAAGDMLESHRVFDEFRGASLEAGKKAIAIRYRLRPSDHTLSAEEIGQIRRAMIEAATGIDAELRGS